MIWISAALSGKINGKRNKELQVTFADYLGGKFMTLSTDIYKLGSAWKMMEQWRKETRTKVGKHQWVEDVVDRNTIAISDEIDFISNENEL